MARHRIRDQIRSRQRNRHSHPSERLGRPRIQRPNDPIEDSIYNHGNRGCDCAILEDTPD